MDYPKFNVSNQKEESISVQEIKLEFSVGYIPPVQQHHDTKLYKAIKGHQTIYALQGQLKRQNEPLSRLLSDSKSNA